MSTGVDPEALSDDDGRDGARDGKDQIEPVVFDRFHMATRDGPRALAPSLDRLRFEGLADESAQAAVARVVREEHRRLFPDLAAERLEEEALRIRAPGITPVVRVAKDLEHVRMAQEDPRLHVVGEVDRGFFASLGEGRIGVLPELLVEHRQLDASKGR